MNIKVRQYVDTDDYWPARFDLIENVKIAFDEQGITIPFPQRDVHFYEERTQVYSRDDRSAGSNVRSVNNKLR